jgi:HEAT repeat protein
MADSTGAAVQNKLVLLKTRDPDAWDVDTLIEWSRDPHDEVRDWATFALGVGSDSSEKVRLALLDRVGDSDFDTMSEALNGLARRKDQRGLEPLVNALRGETVGTLMIVAAGLYGGRELIPPLEELLPWWDIDDELLNEALARCRGEPVQAGRHWDYAPESNC